MLLPFDIHLLSIHLMLSPEHFQYSLSTFSINRVGDASFSVNRVGDANRDASLGFLRQRFSTSIENDIHSRIIYRNDVIARLVKT